MINVLIVDDCPNKVKEIQKGLKGDTPYSLDIASTVNEALSFLSVKIYDFAVIDLALPKRADEDPIPNAGLELIKEVNELDWYKKPRFTIAITQHADLKEEFKSQLEDNGVIIYHYDGTTNICEYVNKNFIGVIKSNTQVDHCIHALIVTALDEEAAPILNSTDFNWSSQETFGIEDIDLKYSDYEVNGSTLKVAIAIMPRMGLVTCAITTSRLVSVLRPKIVLMPGICAGVQNEVKECDLIIASPSWEWQTGKWKGEEFAIEPYQITVDQRLINKAKEVYDSGVLKDIWKNTENKRPDSPPVLHTGAMASGSSVISNASKMEGLKEQHRKLLGLDMEIFGVYSACHNSNIKPLYIGFKSVCDFGNELKGDDYHHFSSELSAKFTIMYLKNIHKLLI